MIKPRVRMNIGRKVVGVASRAATRRDHEIEPSRRKYRRLGMDILVSLLCPT